MHQPGILDWSKGRRSVEGFEAADVPTFLADIAASHEIDIPLDSLSSCVDLQTFPLEVSHHTAV